MSLAEFNPRAVIGGNDPPLKERLPIDYAHLVEEVEALADRADIAPREVTDDIEHGTVANIVRDATKVAKRIEAVRVDETAPYLAGQREVMGFFKPLLDRLQRVAQVIGARGEDYLKRKEAAEKRAREEEERRKREAERIAREQAERLLREAAEAAARQAEADRRAREEEDRRLREAAKLKREEEDRIARAAVAAKREEEARLQREADNVSRQKRQAAERAAAARREQEEREAAEAARVRAEAERAATEAAAKAGADRKAAAEDAERRMREAQAAMDAADRAEQVRAEAEHHANAAPAEMARTRVGDTLTTLARNFDFEITDLAEVDLLALRPYIARPDLEKAIRAFVKIHKNTQPLGGVRIFPTTKAQYR